MHVFRGSHFFVALLSVGALGACASAPAVPVGPVPETPGPGEPQPSVAAPPPVRPGLLGDAAAYDLPVEANGWVQAEMDFLVGQRHEVIGRWLERSAAFEAFVKRTFAAEGVPTDLFHLGMVESGYIPTARSRAGAVGIWQFMSATGRGMGLRIDDWVDERIDPVRSTVAAARHLRQLHASFGDWALAAAAYNAGSGRINRGLQGTGARSFWELATQGNLARETQRYVPRLYAMTIIGHDRKRFGFPLPARAKPFEFDSVEVDLATPLPELARIAQVSVAQLATLNPHLFRGTTPPGRYWVWVPRGRGAAAQLAYQSSAFRRGGGITPYTLRTGEDLLTVAYLAEITPARLRELNPELGGSSPLPGDRLLLPRRAAERLESRPVEPVQLAAVDNPAPPDSAPPRLLGAPVAPPPELVEIPVPSRAASSPAAGVAAAAPADTLPPQQLREYTVREGETVWEIAERFGVAFNDILAANGMETAVVVPGQSLRIPPSDGTPDVPSLPPTSAGPRPPRESVPGAAAHVVGAGDTLWNVAQRYGTTVEALRAANPAVADDIIVPGQRLLIPPSR